MGVVIGVDPHKGSHVITYENRCTLNKPFKHRDVRHAPTAAKKSRSKKATKSAAKKRSAR